MGADGVSRMSSIGKFSFQAVRPSGANRAAGHFENSRALQGARKEETRMNILDRLIADRGAEQRQEWTRLAQILAKGDDQADEMAVSDLAAIAELLRLTDDQLRSFAAVIARAVHLEEAAAAEAERTASYRAATDALTAQQAVSEQQIRAAEADLRAALSRHRNARRELQAAQSAALELRKLRREHAILFRDAEGELLPVPPHEGAIKPPANAGALLDAKPATVYSAEDLRTAFGIDASHLAADDVPETVGGGWLGAVLISYGQRAVIALGQARRQLLESRLVHVEPSWLHLAPEQLYSRQQLTWPANFQPADIIARGVGQYEGAAVSAWARKQLVENENIRHELAALDAADGMTTSASINALAPETTEPRLRRQR